MLRTITTADRIAKAQGILAARIQDAATKSGRIELGYQGGGSEEMVYFLAPLDLWVALGDSGNRYWNALGIGDPFKTGHTIAAEINTPKSGIDRRIAGAFVVDPFGKIHMAHRGGVGGGRKGIGKNAFLARYRVPLEVVRDGDKNCEMIVVGALDDEDLLDKLAAFTRKVAVFKEEAVSGNLR